MSTLISSPLPFHGGRRFSTKVTQLFSLEWVVSLQTRIRHEMEVRSAIAEMKRLDDRCLEDIGVRRNDIERVVRG